MISNPSPLIELVGLSHAYDDELVLDGVDWTVDAGEKWGVLGASGAGKTTLVEIIAGLTRPNRGGTVRRNGQDQLNLARWRRSVGWLSTDLIERIPGYQSVLDTVVAGKHSQTLKASRSGLSYSDEDEGRAGELLERIGLDDHGAVRFDELSQGERQLALVARTFMGRPELLILDEPCAGLDPGARERFLAEIESFLEDHDGTAVLYVTHHVEELLPAFSSVLALKEGRVVHAGSRDDLLAESDLSELYGTGFELRRRNGRYWPVGTTNDSSGTRSQE